MENNHIVQKINPLYRLKHCHLMESRELVQNYYKKLNE